MLAEEAKKNGSEKTPLQKSKAISKSNENKSSSIFDIKEGVKQPVGLFTDPKDAKDNESNKQVDKEIAKLKEAFKEIKEDQKQGHIGINSLTTDTISKQMTEVTKREAQKTEYDLYNEVFIDEVNQELLKNIHKCEGEIVVLLVRQERLKKFAEVWK